MYHIPLYFAKKGLISMKKLCILFLLLVLICSARAELPLSCGEYSYLLENDGTATILSYTGWQQHLSVPAQLDGHPVSAIASKAFAYTDSLISITLPEGLHSIGYGAFFGCTSLTEISLPASLCTLDGNPFSGCFRLAEVRLANGSRHFCVKNGVLFDQSLETLYLYPPALSNARYAIPQGTVRIAEGAFYSAEALHSITVPDSVTVIDSYAFGYCTALGKIILPDSVTELGEFAFYSCTSLNHATLSAGLKAISAHTFEECSALVSVSIPQGIACIGASAFINCSALKTLSLPDSITTLEIDSFFGCSSLESVTLPYHLSPPDINPFAGCTNLTNFYLAPDHPAMAVIDNVLFDKTAKRLLCYPAGLQNKHYEVPAGIRIIGKAAFEYTQLESITLPDTVTTIDSWGFFFNTALHTVVLPESLQSIGASAFAICSALNSSVKLPESLTLIGDNAFASVTDCQFVVARGSYAETWLTQQNIPFAYGLSVGDTFLFGDYTCQLLPEKTVEIIRYHGADRHIVIPQQLDGYRVVSIADGAFYCHQSAADRLSMHMSPAQKAAQALQYEVYVTLPDSIISIAPAAFAGRNATFRFTVEAGSATEHWARENGYRYDYSSPTDWLKD